MVKINIKWGKEKYEVDVDPSQPVSVLKSQIYSLTQVPVDRQKIMGFKGGILKDETQWKDVDLVEGKNVMMMGSAAELEKPKEPVKFIEDLPEETQNTIMNDMPTGLANLGNTCYLNSTLQTLKAVPELVKSIQTYKQPSNPSMYASLVKASQVLFNELTKSNLPMSTILFLSTFRRMFPQFAEEKGGHFLQQDAEEAMSQLLTAFSYELAAPGQTLNPNDHDHEKSIINKLFGIETIDTMTCKDNPSEDPTNKIETLLKLACNINIETSYLHEGLKRGLEEEITKKSPTLNREAVYLKKTAISKLPPYLFVQFVRFHWKKDVKESRDSATVGVKAKIIRPVQFPFMLDVQDMCTPELKEKLAVKRKIIEDQFNQSLERKRKPLDDQEMSDVSKPPEKKPDNKSTSATSDVSLDIKPNDTGKYELSAVLTHQGRYADSGHYVAWVKKADNQWYQFNDNIVTLHTDEDIKKLYGGTGDWHMSYILLYKSVNVEEPTAATEESSSSTTTTTTTTK
ncbi:ubiquitin domain-containing protein [Heterostelium album PN500]|uniref:Ubiquitin carboxyl-terminal hydrolase n=1 Tax=Heterostelium pallidum (strain ATCC 26659 / Pp 5 / PN500) TaxID=670386 RepID=D3B9R2_HETP5|nr:ubiquitin domain-containing protein [Heterostelium album PN500]EFA81974.1 ubiquitin domain-containing protein [Heterostelium album PN500]|eukprot:XP_020434091.1 ubiquitin domain-containing protein [Heterostelium album PN500]